MGDGDLLRDFERAQRRKGLRSRTVVERSRTLARLARAGPLLAWSTDELEDWLDAQNIGLRSRACYLSHFRAFFTWAVITGRRVDDPTTPIVKPRLPRKLPRPIGDDDLDVAIRMAPPRMRAWLLLACYQGLRAMEVAQVAREDVLDRHVPPLLRIPNGKGGTDSVIPLHPDVLAALHEVGMPQSGPLFVSNRGRAFSPATVSGYMADFLHGLGVPATGHRLRDWYGSAVYASTHDLRLTQEMMRHRDPSSTAGYVAYSRPEAVEAVTQLEVGKERTPGPER